MDRGVAHERALLVAHQEYDADDAEHRGEKEQTHFSSDSHEAPGSELLFLHGVLLEKIPCAALASGPRIPASPRAARTFRPGSMPGKPGKIPPCHPAPRHRVRREDPRPEQPRLLSPAQTRPAMAPAHRNPDAAVPPVRRRLVAERHLRVNRVTRSRVGAGRRVGVAHSLAVTRPKNAWPNTR